MQKTNLTYYLLLIVILAPNFTFADDSEKILSQLQKKYDGLKDATISFAQKMQFTVSKKEQSFVGKLTFKKGNKYKIEVGEQTIITNGKTVWTYSKSNKQVLVNDYQEEEDMLTPDKIMTALPKQFTSETIGKEKLGSLNTTVIKLFPKEKSSMQFMQAWVDESAWLMRKIQIHYLNGNTTTYSIDEIKLNTGISDSLFMFNAPKGVEVIDMR
ncbi:MAG: outer membrane lipoprotein carrier protein LolA [Ignavibacteriae bacterium]|nr:outer membrane lipoprotein carrier protein LolA [Ignavibacteriota bacterium]